MSDTYREKLVNVNSMLLMTGNDYSDVLLGAASELSTLRQRAEWAEADSREYRNLCEVLMEGNRRSIKLASDLLVAESTIADLQATVDRLRGALTEAIESVEDWSGYASPYFRDKYDVEGQISSLRSVLKNI